MRLLLATAALAALSAGGLSTDAHAAACSGRLCRADITLAGPLVDSDGDKRHDSTLRVSNGRSIELVSFTGKVRWRVPLESQDTQAKRVATGDLDRDGVTDYLFWTRRPIRPLKLCGGTPVVVATLLIVNGRTHRTSEPVPALEDICWNTPTFNYPTHQWDSGTASIGDFTPSRPGVELVAFPTYATEGWVYSIDDRGHWERVHGRDGAGRLIFPSTPAFDREYNRANRSPCMIAPFAQTCHVPESHAANPIFLRRPLHGMLMLTSERALRYRPDLTPTDDTVWVSGGSLDNGGRNYGLVEEFARTSRSATIDLLGGCGVVWTRNAMRGEGSDNPHCGIHRHLERFATGPDGVRRLGGHYYGYSNADLREGKLVFYRGAHARLRRGGRANVSFNVFRNGRWQLQIGSGAGFPPRLRSHDDWFAWDAADFDGDGAAEIVATRSDGFTPPFSTDVLRWDGRELRSIAHLDGYIPTLIEYGDAPDHHSPRNDTHGVFARDAYGDGVKDLLVENAARERRFLRWR